MTRPDDAQTSAGRLKCDAPRRHEGTCAKNSTKIIVYRLHDGSWSVVLGAAMMKKEFGQGRHQSSGSAVASSVSNPKEDPAVFHPQPAIDIATDLNHGPITCCNLPSG